MPDEQRPKKYSSLAQSAKQRLIDDLLKAHFGKRDVGAGAHLSDAEREEQKKNVLDVLDTHMREMQSQEDFLRELKIDADAVKEFVDGGRRTLDQLLVSKESRPFESFEELDAHFGPLPDGYCYRYLAYELSDIPDKIFQDANNVVRLPIILDEEVTARYKAPGDEFLNDPSLECWLTSKPMDVKKLWALRVLANLGILKDQEVPSIKPAAGSVPSAGKRIVEPALPEGAEKNPAVKALLDRFVEDAIVHYDAEEEEKYGGAFDGVWGKRCIVDELIEIRPWRRSALRPLLDHPDLGVRVSAAVYLLRSIPQIAIPVLRKIAAMKTSAELEQKHANIASAHAAQTLWMYEDGNLNI